MLTESAASTGSGACSRASSQCWSENFDNGSCRKVFNTSATPSTRAGRSKARAGRESLSWKLRCGCLHGMVEREGGLSGHTLVEDNLAAAIVRGFAGNPQAEPAGLSAVSAAHPGVEDVRARTLGMAGSVLVIAVLNQMTPGFGSADGLINVGLTHPGPD